MTPIRESGSVCRTVAERTATVESESVVETRKGADPGSQPQGGPRDASLKIVIVDESPIRAAILEDGLREAGFVQVQRIEETRNLLSRILRA